MAHHGMPNLKYINTQTDLKADLKQHTIVGNCRDVHPPQSVVFAYAAAVLETALGLSQDARRDYLEIVTRKTTPI